MWPHYIIDNSLQCLQTSKMLHTLSNSSSSFTTNIVTAKTVRNTFITYKEEIHKLIINTLIHNTSLNIALFKYIFNKLTTMSADWYNTAYHQQQLLLLYH